MGKVFVKFIERSQGNIKCAADAAARVTAKVTDSKRS